MSHETGEEGPTCDGSLFTYVEMGPTGCQGPPTYVEMGPTGCQGPGDKGPPLQSKYPSSTYDTPNR